MDEISNYIKKNLEDYIKKELEYGYSFEAIRKALVIKHQTTVVDEVIEDLKKQKFKTIKKKPAKDLSEDAYNYVTKFLIDYVKKQHQKGYSVNDIHQALINYGHAKVAVDAAIEHFHTGSLPPYRGKPKEHEHRSAEKHEHHAEPRPRHIATKLDDIKFLIFFSLFFALLFWVSIGTDENVLFLFLLYSPIVITLFIGYKAKSIFSNVKYVVFVPAALVLLYYGLAYGHVFGPVEKDKIAVVNLVFSYVALFAMMDLKEFANTQKTQVKFENNKPVFTEEPPKIVSGKKSTVARSDSGFHQREHQPKSDSFENPHKLTPYKI